MAVSFAVQVVWQRACWRLQPIYVQGSLLALAGTTTAAILAFQLSRSVGRRLAERVIAEEIGEGDSKRGMFAGVQEAIDSGSFQQQLVAVTLLRLTPVVPFR